MKTMCLVFSVFLLSLSISPFSDFLTENYKGGEKEFLMKVYSTIKYPMAARTNCGIGKLKTRLTISEAGTIESIEFLNKLGYGIEREVERTIRLTNGDWLSSNSKRTFDFVVAFQIGSQPELKADINVMVAGFGSQGEVTCKSNEAILEELTKKMQKEKYKKNKKLSEELLKREPDSQHYNALNTMVKQKLEE